MITGNKGPNQLPLNKRALNVLDEIIKRKEIPRHQIDDKVIKYLLKKNLIRIRRKTSFFGNFSIDIVESIQKPESDQKIEYQPEKPKKKNLLDEGEIFYLEIPTIKIENKIYDSGIYKFECAYNQINEKIRNHANKIWFISSKNKVFYVNNRATNNKKPTKFPRKELTWIQMKAKVLE